MIYTYPVMFGTNLKKARQNLMVRAADDSWRSLSIKAVSEEMGVKRLTIFRWENEMFNPSIPEICKLCDYYGVTPNELFTGVAYEYNGEKKQFDPMAVTRQPNHVELLFEGKIPSLK